MKFSKLVPAAQLNCKKSSKHKTKTHKTKSQKTGKSTNDHKSGSGSSKY